MGMKGAGDPERLEVRQLPPPKTSSRINRDLNHLLDYMMNVKKWTHGEKLIRSLFQQSGIEINGAKPFDIQINKSQFYQKILSKWSLGLGESYMDGDWDCAQLDEFIFLLLKQDLNDSVIGFARFHLVGEVLRAKLLNLQSKNRAFQVGEVHYDAGNDLFEKMLDRHMIYSCAYWEKASDLNTAQEHKLKLICEKLELKPGENLLEIGCGWGGLAAYAAKNYGVEVLGITISKEQQKLALGRCKDLPVKIELIDYRDLQGNFDKIVSVGMFEHVGVKNYRNYFDHASRLLRDEGLFLLHTIGSEVAVNRTDPWIDKYIFPNGQIPSPTEITENIDRLFLIEDWHNFGQDYDKTLMAWYQNFNDAWPQLSENYNNRFYRMWKYYLLSCAGYFRSRQGQLWQLVLSKRARTQTYRSKRLANLIM
jgi:cyclopropane-fatty-acyl-phospholipid synthase